MVIQLRLVCLVMSTVWAVTTHPRPPPTQSDARYSSPSSCFTSRIIINNDKLACIVLAGACLIALINPTWGDRGEMIILWCAACVAPTSRGWCPGHLMNWSQLFASWAHLRWSAACLLRGMLECWSHYSLLISQCLVVKIVILARLWTLSRHATLFSLQVSHYGPVPEWPDIPVSVWCSVRGRDVRAGGGHERCNSQSDTHGHLGLCDDTNRDPCDEGK